MKKYGLNGIYRALNFYISHFSSPIRAVNEASADINSRTFVCDRPYMCVLICIAFMCMNAKIHAFIRASSIPLRFRCIAILTRNFPFATLQVDKATAIYSRRRIFIEE